MADVWRFVMAVASHWILLVGGAAVIVLIGVAERLIKKELSPRLYIGLLIGLFFSASFLAWKDEHDKVATRRNFVIGFNQIAVGYLSGGENGKQVGIRTVTVHLGVVNRGPASILRDWKMFVKPPNTATRTPLPILDFPPQEQMTFSGVPPLSSTTLVGSEAIWRKTLDQRIETGAWTSGFLIGATNAFTMEQLSVENVEVIVECEDAFGEIYSVTHVLHKTDEK
jgi:hypothetical protein